ncbi:MAG: YidC/Oxa1 family membrane protein insertase [Acidimicrobiia bacterium]
MWNSLLDGMGSVLAFFYSAVPSYGVAIIGLTIIVRLVLFPLTAKQARSQLKMTQAAPEIKKIQAKYKDDRPKQNEEVMKYYKENKINPVAGCLPLLAQMPIFFALFAVLRSPIKHIPTGSKLNEAFCGDAIERGVACTRETVKGLRFLGMDLSRAASEAKDGFTDALPYYLLIALVVVTGYLQFKQTQSRQTSQANPQMAMMGKIFPVMFAFISFSLPSGVVLYFLVSNAWQIGQQALIYGHLMPEEAPPAGGNGAVETAKKAPPPPKARDPKPGAQSEGADGKADRSGKTPG